MSIGLEIYSDYSITYAGSLIMIVTLELYADKDLFGMLHISRGDHLLYFQPIIMFFCMHDLQVLHDSPWHFK